MSIVGANIRLLNERIKAAHRKVYELCAKLGQSRESEPRQAARAARRGDPALLARDRKSVV